MTKCKIGDIVWCVDLDTTKWEYFVDCFILHKIHTTTEKDKIVTFYCRRDSIHPYFEEDCFIKREDAEKHCKYKNKGEV